MPYWDCFTPLDNAAKIYPCIADVKANAQFRLGAYVKKTVCPELLVDALANLKNRFPLLYTQLHEGKYWDYLKPVGDTDVVYRDNGKPMPPFPLFRTDKPLFRVLYSDKYIGIEFFHSLTDGSGGMVFFKALLWEYFCLCGEGLSDCGDVLTKNQVPDKEEFEDSFQKFYDRRIGFSRKEATAIQYPCQKDMSLFKINQLILPVDKLKAITHQYDCTVTDYLVTLCLCSIAKASAEKGVFGKITAGVPINVRRIFPSKTLRNFSLFTNVSIWCKGEVPDVKTALEDVKAQVKAGTAPALLAKMASQNVHEEKQWIARVTPMKYKRPVMRAIIGFYGNEKVSTQFSNLGLVKLPKEMEELIDHMEVFLGASGINVHLFGAVSYNNKLCITLTGKTLDMRVKNIFIEYLKQDQIIATESEK